MFFTRDKSFYRSFFHLFIVVVLQNVVAYSVKYGGQSDAGQLQPSSSLRRCHRESDPISGPTGDPLLRRWDGHPQRPVLGESATSPPSVRDRDRTESRCVLGAGIFALTALFPAPIVGLFTPDPQIIAAGVEYLSVIKFTYPFYILSTLMMAALRSVETVNHLLWDRPHEPGGQRLHQLSAHFRPLRVSLNWGSWRLHRDADRPDPGISGGALFTSPGSTAACSCSPRTLPAQQRAGAGLCPGSRSRWWAPTCSGAWRPPSKRDPGPALLRRHRSQLRIHHRISVPQSHHSQ